MTQGNVLELPVLIKEALRRVQQPWLTWPNVIFADIYKSLGQIARGNMELGTAFVPGQFPDCAISQPFIYLRKVKGRFD